VRVVYVLVETPQQAKLHNNANIRMNSLLLRSLKKIHSFELVSFLAPALQQSTRLLTRFPERTMWQAWSLYSQNDLNMNSCSCSYASGGGGGSAADARLAGITYRCGLDSDPATTTTHT
jgi:hypothetical protein